MATSKSFHFLFKCKNIFYHITCQLPLKNEPRYSTSIYFYTWFPSRTFNFHFMKPGGWQQQKNIYLKFFGANILKFGVGLSPQTLYVVFEILIVQKMCNSIIHKAWLLLMIIMMALSLMRRKSRPKSGKNCN